MQLYDIGALLFLAAAIHASFAVSVSILTLMSGHALGSRASARRVLRLSSGFALGSMTMIALVVALLAVVMANLLPGEIPRIVWCTLSGVMLGVGVAVWLFYYRRRRGTMLWLPRPMAHYLRSRSRATRSSAEAFGLGLSSVLAELLFTLAPMLLAALLLVHLEPPMQLAGLLIYTMIASLPLLIITMLVGAGHSLGKIQRWREHNKRFLQFAAGSALIVLGAALYVDTVIAQTGIIWKGGV